jgi:hypothetical protein
VNWLSDNWKLLFDGVGGAAAVAIIGYVCKRWLWPQPPEQGANLTAQGASVHESPVASGSGITQTIGDTHNHFYPLASAAAVESTPPSPPPQPRLDESASLTPLPAREVLVHLDRGTLYEASTDLESARKAVALPFKNVSKPTRQQTPRASSVTASLTFKNADASDGPRINHGVWLGRFQYATTFDSGATHELLIALKDVRFVTLENPNATNPFQRRFRSGMTIHSPQMKLVGTEGTVEIVLVDGFNVTMFQGTFEYQLSIEKMVLTPKTLNSSTKIHFVPDAYNHGWAGNDGHTDIRAGGIFTYEGDGMLTIVDAFLKGTTPKGKMTMAPLVGDALGPLVSNDTLELRAHTSVRVALGLLAEPIKTERGKPMRGQLILRDVYNKEYEIDPVDFPWIGQPVRESSNS